MLRHRFVGSIALAIALALPLAALAAPGARSLEGAFEEIPLPARAAGDRVAATFTVDRVALGAQLDLAPRGLPGRVGGVSLELPLPTGGFLAFEVVEEPVLSPAMEAAWPGIRTYKGFASDGSRVRFALTPLGVDGVVRGDDGSYLLQPLEGSRGAVVVASQGGLAREAFECLGSPLGEALPELREELGGPRRAAALGSELRTYEMAITGTGEFVSHHGGTSTAASQITTLVNSANLVYEDEFAVSFDLIDINLYTNAATDPFPTGNVLNGNLLQQNDNVLDSKLGNNGYELGHILSQVGGGASGLAYVGVNCSNLKGGGGTVSGNPTSGNLIGVFLHEVGHQMGASHTFNSSDGGCSGNRSASAAYEIGSGVTIMSYAGLCASENVLPDQIDYFHAYSQQQITSRINSTSGCGSTVPTGNDPPVVEAGPNYTIPVNTAFVLEGSATDANGDPVKYTWEQLDLGAATPPQDAAQGPNFRNFGPSTSPVRALPFYPAYRQGVLSAWEFLPTANRFLNFRLVGRDFNIAGGGVAWDQMQINVSGAQFAISSPNGGESYPGGSSQVATWDVGGSTADSVRILVSIDSGLSWTESVASTPNDGSAEFTVPCDQVPTARIRIEALENIFYDISNADFTVTADNIPPVLTCPADITLESLDGNPVPRTDPRLDPFWNGVSAEDGCGASVQDFGPQTFPVGETTSVPFFAQDTSNNSSFCTADVTVLYPVGNPPVADVTALRGVYPNPFNPRTTIRFSLASDQEVALEVLDLRGRRVGVVHDGPLPAGMHELDWDASDGEGNRLPSGVYFFRMDTAEGVFTARAALVE